MYSVDVIYLTSYAVILTMTALTIYFARRARSRA